MDEVVLDDSNARMFVCSDSYYCAERRAAGHVGQQADHELSQLSDDQKAGEGVPA
jgi:alpha-D-ribose 1-methylphosphonate 5-phosphate C-P lyase